MSNKVDPEGGTTDVAIAESGDKEPIIEREQWDNKAQFLLTCIGFAVGLGNIWRFPYVLQTSGGGAFLIPYFIMLILEGIPLLYVELSVGQYIRKGSVGVWTDISKYMGGIGICSMFVSFLVAIYYNTIIAWCLWYLFHSFQSPLPWSSCPLNENLTAYVQECDKSSPTQYFWYRETLDITEDISVGGGVQTNLLLCQMIAWLLVFICLSKGIASSGKVVYVTATFPYLVLFIFLIRGLTLEGASAGLSYLFNPDYEKLSDPNIWLTASTQIFFSLSLAFGGMIAFSSFNPRHNNCERDTLIVAFANSGTSILASVVIFSVLGFKATLEFKECASKDIDLILNTFDLPEGHINTDTYTQYIEDNTIKLAGLPLSNCSVENGLKDAASGTGLAFIVMTEAILSMPASPFWAILFFLMLLTLGLDSMFGTLEGVMTPLGDLGILPKRLQGIGSLVLVVIVSFCVSIIFLQGSGNYWLDVFDTYAGGLPLLIIAFFELAAVGWVFRYDRYSKAITEMIGEAKNPFTKFLHYYWWATIPALSPVLLFAVFVYYLYDKVSNPNTYDVWIESEGQTQSKLYPGGATAVMVVLALLCTIWIPLRAAYYLVMKFVIKPRRGLQQVGIDMKKRPSSTEDKENGQNNDAYEKENTYVETPRSNEQESHFVGYEKPGESVTGEQINPYATIENNAEYDEIQRGKSTTPNSNE